MTLDCFECMIDKFYETGDIKVTRDLYFGMFSELSRMYERTLCALDRNEQAIRNECLLFVFTSFE